MAQIVFDWLGTLTTDQQTLRPSAPNTITVDLVIPRRSILDSVRPGCSYLAHSAAATLAFVAGFGDRLVGIGDTSSCSWTRSHPQWSVVA